MLAVLVGVLAVGVGAPAAHAATGPLTAPVAAAPPVHHAQEQGPTLDPQTEADARKNRNKIIVGGAAAVLLGIVLWGRHVRNKKRKAKK